MPEVKRKVRPVEVNYVCDACGQGVMSRCGEVDPKTGDIEHHCLICDPYALDYDYPQLNGDPNRDVPLVREFFEELEKKLGRD